MLLIKLYVAFSRLLIIIYDDVHTLNLSLPIGGLAYLMPRYAWNRLPRRVSIHDPRMEPAGVFTTGFSGVVV